ncbi:MAG: Gfo/Idh/MocA family oxidoreductase [Anaerolineae bacterium]|nr:Gfo/Idh/MocA family oxidoreductase [Anaerolineae bacterium]
MPLTAAVIGLSRYARDVHIPFLLSEPDVRLVAIAGSNPARTGPPAGLDLPGVTHYSNYHALLDAPATDFVIIASAPVPHYEQITACLEQGRHVLVDKAFVCSQAQAEAVVGLARAHALLLGVVVQRRYETAIRHLSETVRAGHIGKVRSVRANYARWYAKDANHWRNDPAVAWGGMLADNGYHLLDEMLWMAGLHPERVQAELHNEGMAVEQTAALNIRFEGGAVGSVLATYLAPRGFIREEVFIHGTQGAVFFQRQQDPGGPLRAFVTHLDAQGQTQPVPPHEHTADRHAPHHNFVQALRGREDLLASGADSIATVALIDAAYQSARNEKPQAIVYRAG